MTDIWDLRLIEVAALTRGGDLSARELVSQSLNRIEESDPTLGAFVLVDRQGATEVAERLDAIPAGSRGPLHGVPVAIKDIFDVAGHPTRRGSDSFADSPPATRDAESVRRLRAAGAVIVGKTTTHELACGVYTSPTRNPWDPTRSPGGSSGGSGAAVSARLVYGATGSDTGGSIRIPASLCGLVGLKPTYGRISRIGVASLAWSLDHIGPLARCVDDAWLLFDVMAGEDPRDPATVGLSDWQSQSRESPGTRRVGIPDEVFCEGLTTEVEAVWSSALSQLTSEGVECVPISVPSLRGALAAEFAIVLAEGAAYNERVLATRGNQIGKGVRLLLEAGLRVPALTYLRAQRAREVLQAEFQHAFDRHGLHGVMTPTLPGTAQRHDEVDLTYPDGSESVADAFVRTTGPFNLTGMPTVSVPGGLASNGLPVGLQIAGRPYDEAGLRVVAQHVEASLGRCPSPFEDQ